MKTRKGGLRVHLTERQTEHRPLCSREGYDCGANAFSGIGFMNQEDAKYLALLTPNGLNGDDFLRMVNMAYNGGSRWEQIDTEQKLSDALGVGQGIIGSFTWTEEHGEGGHYFVILKMPGGHPSVPAGLYVMDSQSGENYRFKDYVAKWTKSFTDAGVPDGPMRTFYVLTSRVPGFANDEITREIINTVLRPDKRTRERAEARAPRAEARAPGGFGTPGGFGAPGGFGGPSPGFGAPAPGFGGPSPGFGAPSPGFGAPAPGFGGPAPGFGGPAPGFGGPAPGFGGPSPGFGAPAPGGFGAAATPGIQPFNFAQASQDQRQRFPSTQPGFTTPFGFGPRGGRNRQKSRKARRNVK